MIHGGIIEDYPLFPKSGIDFSVNVNPLGFPKGVKGAIKDNINLLYRYPDFNYRKVFKNVSDYLGVDEENIVLGNGSMEIIDLLIQSANRVIIKEPCFNEYKRRAEVRGKEVINLKDLNFKPLDMVILGNPNNPTGDLLKDKEEIYHSIKKSGAFLVLDETFSEFSDTERESIKYFKSFDYDSVAIIRAATKFFALPGLRFGYGVMSKERCEELKIRQNPWNLNAMVEPVSNVIFKDSDYIKKSKMLIKEEREYLMDKYSYFNMVKMRETDANFYLLEIIGNAEDLFKFLLDCGILARIFESRDLKGEFLRFAIRDRRDNDRLLKAIKKYEERNYGTI